MGNGQSSSSSQPVDGRAGYVDPEEQARRDRQDKQFGEAMNSNGTRIYQQRAAEDEKVNAAAAGGGFKMDIAAMRKLQPKWQEIADKLDGMIQTASQLKVVPPPADDPASTLQKKAADGHADAYVASLQQQRDYAQGYADKLKDAISKYENQDHANTNSLRKQG
ncbi:type VII secretion target [Amycolatopsis echigonensis]|uniref:PE domain-containing protein n=1 Tax=Amycolatopsis echigonensis TaxID=2576905 RepID=A0A8E1VZ49_9PSEU|nr:type VII secretion target [Amycolatopsis echigonensis]MBB2500996.1 PE domain-containing protein [Amycolatopsis echigonensis]